MAETATRRRRAIAQPPDPSAPLKAKVLIVDDDERNAFAAVQALEDLGHDLVVARSGDEALRRVLEDDFAVILLDLHMPGMDGYETASLIRQRKRMSQTPIVFVTAIFRDEPHVFQAYDAGAVDVVFKPVDPFILRAKVSVLADLYLKTEAMKRHAAYQEWLLAENQRIQAEKAAAERRLRRSEARQTAILRSLPVVFHSRRAGPPFEVLFVSEAVREVTGFRPEDFTSDPRFGFDHIHPDDVQRVTERLAAAVETGAYEVEFRWRCANGEYRYLHDQGVLAPAEAGDPAEIFGVLLDATERRCLEEDLAQARKMEAVGQLTGGIAHDFNNLLTVILGHADMLARKSEEDAKRATRVGAIREAGERGRDLTKQLLAFSRRQQLSPVTLDINKLVTGFAPLLRQAVGEAISLDLQLEPSGLNAHVDPMQLETALLNLCVNARDAMPGGGTLTVTTSGVESGASRWVGLEVRDNGVGMDAEVQAKVFEPFFTTKDVGKGSGLGLSQVYGFVRQSGGEIGVESAPGAGSSFSILLPRSADPAMSPNRRRSSAGPRGGDEHLLVVEDNPAVLALTLDLVSGLGYRVTTATAAEEALKLLEGDGEYDLLFSDVVMPGGLSGVDLARRALELRPKLKVLLTSGYIAGAKAAEEFPMLDKPYETAVLAKQLRKALGERGRRRAAAQQAANLQSAAT